MDLESRRRFLQGGLAAGSLFLPAPYAWVWAQSEGAVRLLRLPKVALVIGNSAYVHAGRLNNTRNDANDMAQALRAAGFEVMLRMDASRNEMRESFEAHARTLAAKKCVGLVYFAGHGFQLAWRNYLVPVEAALDKIDDVARRCVDVGEVLDLIRKSANAMNVVILDACRNNPFDTNPGRAPGLSQMDAPPATLLAYATAPGNEASDRETDQSRNGLYTSYLLREMQVREAKIEDVFKRVRLSVRRASKGEQIPWESTSLEEDFYFLPPEQLRKLSQEEEERQFREEEALFEKVRQSRSAQLAEDYLRRYPSGRFCELAQLTLDTLLAAQGEKRIEVVSAKDNPNTAGFARADTQFKIGDRYVYRRMNRKPGGWTRDSVQVVTSITNDEVIFSDGVYVTDLLGNTRKAVGQRRFTALQELPLEYQVGKRWSTRYEETNRRGEGVTTMECRIVAREKVTVPAGTFDCFRIEGVGVNRGAGRADVDFIYKQWRAPEVRRPICGEDRRRTLVRGHVSDFFEQRNELLSFTQA